MPIEIEKKYRLTKELSDEIAEKLNEYGAVYEGEDFEENIIFQSENLSVAGSIIRIRVTDKKTLLTYKRRIQNEFAVKQQIEHETDIGCAKTMEEILTNLGAQKKLVYEKRRRTWKFRKVEIVLDELPFGYFMEIEGSFTSIAEAEMILDIEDLETEHDTYPSLTAREGSRRGQVVEARFFRKTL